MKLLVSDRYTNRVRTQAGDVVYFPPGHPFPCLDEHVEAKIASGRARRPNAVDQAKVADAAPSTGTNESGSETDSERLDQVAAAILELDEDDRDLFLEDGRPKVDALAKVLGGPVSAEERDAAWKALEDDD